LRWLHDFCSSFCGPCDALHLLICIHWAILAFVEWNQFDQGECSLSCTIKFSLLVFCWEFLHPCSTQILNYSFLLLLLCSFLVLVAR
jgi:hypothetical protein